MSDFVLRPRSVNPYLTSVSHREVEDLALGDHHERESNTAIAVMSNSTDSPLPGKQTTPTSKTCLVCDNKHTIEKCEKFLAMDVNERALLGKEKRVCFSCFESADHQSRDCTRKKRCDMEDCGKCHYPLIHGAAPVFVVKPSGNSPPLVPPLNTAAPVFVGTSSIKCVPSAVLLQIVPVVVVTPEGVKVAKRRWEALLVLLVLLVKITLYNWAP